jgi:pyruvate/2-oxoglutarate dehydrogenase complex dihydrolipoamide acyltransferase (E2) component
LSGGQVLKRAAIKGLHLTPLAVLPATGSVEAADSGAAVIPGVAFYDFALIPSLKVFKQEYRRRLDSLGSKGLAVGDADLMVAEANYAFALNTALFQELDLLAGFDKAPVDFPEPPDRATVLARSAQAAAAAASAAPAAPASAAPGAAAPAGRAALSAADMAAQAQAAAGGCPFASLVRAGVPAPAAHSLATTAAKPTSAAAASAPEDGCPLRRFGFMDLAVVLVLVAAMLLAMPSLEARQ